MSDELTPRLDHVSLSVEDLDRGVAFYTPLLEALGLERVAELGPEVAGSVSCAGFGVGRKSQLWLAETGRQSPRAHLCFRARSRAEVRAFHAAGLAAGADCARLRIEPSPSRTASLICPSAPCMDSMRWRPPFVQPKRRHRIDLPSESWLDMVNKPFPNEISLFPTLQFGREMSTPPAFG